MPFPLKENGSAPPSGTRGGHGASPEWKKCQKKKVAKIHVIFGILLCY